MCHTWYFQDNLGELFKVDNKDIKVDPYKYEKKIFNNTCRTFIKPGASREDLEQVDSDMDEKEDPYKFKKNLFKYTCRTFNKPGASRQD